MNEIHEGTESPARFVRNDAYVAFLYYLVQDHVNLGDIKEIMDEVNEIVNKNDRHIYDDTRVYNVARGIYFELKEARNG